MKRVYFPLFFLISFTLSSHGNINSSSNKPTVCSQAFHTTLLSLSDPWPDYVSIYTDGASRGNPGHSAFGLQVLNMKGEIIYEDNGYLGSNKTNNFSEYQAVIHALKLAKQKKINHLIVYSDSLLVINQLNKKWKVEHTDLKPLFLKCQEILKEIPSHKFIHISRGKNKGADALANQALDNR